MFTNEILFTIQAFTITRVHCISFHEKIIGNSKLFEALYMYISVVSVRMLLAARTVDSGNSKQYLISKHFW